MSKAQPHHIPKYTVKQVAEMTGVSRNQIRLWEHRFQLVEPYRADNGYRLYSDDDIKVIQYVSQERKKGLSLSIILQTPRPDMLSGVSSPEPISTELVKSSSSSQHINWDLICKALIEGDIITFENLLIELQAGKSFVQAIKEYDLPILRTIGELETKGGLPISSSHLSANVIKRRIFSHIQNMGMASSTHPVIIAGAPNDHHEIGMLICLMELVKAHYPVLYLGPHTPIKELSNICNNTQPVAVILSITKQLSMAKAKELAAQYADLIGNHFPIAVGGYEANAKRKLFEKSGFQVLDSPELVFDFLKNK